MDLERSGSGGANPRARASDTAAETAFALLDGLWLAPLGIALLDGELRFLQVNEAFARLTGLRPEAHVGRAPRDLFPGQESLASAAEERLRAVLDSGRPALDAAATSRAPDGRLRTWRASVYPVLAPDGAVRAVCAMVDETTHVHDRERALERARAAAERNASRLALLQGITAALSAAVEAAEVGAAVIEHLRAFIEADAVSIRTLGPEGLAPLAASGPRGEGSCLGSALPPSAAAPAVDALRGELGVWLESLDAIDARYPHLLEAARAEGYEACAALPLRARGRAIGALSLAFHAPREFDLEERALLLSIADLCAQAIDRARLLEDERAQRVAAERDRAILDGIFANAPLGMALLDRDLRFVRVNPVLAAMDGAPLEAHAGRAPAEVLPSLAWKELEPGLHHVLQTGTPRVDVPVELPATGRVQHFLSAWYPVRVGGETIGLGVIAREVTAQREAEQFQRNVLGIVGHDLRTPLSTVTTAAYLLAREALTGAQARLVARIDSAGARIDQVIRILHDYAQASGGLEIPVHPRTCDVAAICREVADETEGAHPDRSVRCTGEDDRAGEWDPDRIRQALANVVSNAVEHGAPGAPVDVRWRGDADLVEIEVENAGAAIPPDLLPRIFDAFRRGRSERRSGGLGLGLFIARAIVIAHGGQIQVRSGEGRTAFAIRLPRRRLPRG